MPENLIENKFKTKGRLLFALLASGDDWQMKPSLALWIDDNSGMVRERNFKIIIYFLI